MASEAELLALAERVAVLGPADRVLDMEIHEALCDGFDMMPDATEADVADLLPDGADVASFMEECGGFAVVRVPFYTEDRIGTAIELRARAATMGGSDD
jgi:hypothetical protein